MNKPTVCIAYGITGGRHPQMFGLGVEIENALKEAGIGVLSRMGFSGGSIVSALLARQVDPEGWLRHSVKPKFAKHGQVGGYKGLENTANFLLKGGLLDSAKLLNRVFEHIIPGEIVSGPAFACAWCVSSGVEVVFRLTEQNMASRVLCSAALPFAISPVKIRNDDLAPEIQKLTRVEDDPGGHSFFIDAGVSSALGVNLFTGIPEVEEAGALMGKPIPVIGVNINPIFPRYNKGFGGFLFYRKIWESCWGMVSANVLDDVDDASEDRPVFLCVAPTPPELAHYSTKFDIDFQAAKRLFDVGAAQARDWLEKSGVLGKLVSYFSAV